MSDAKTAWTEAGDSLSGLGLKLKLHYEQQRSEETENVRHEVETAVERLTEVVKEAFDAVGAAAKDEAVRDDVKQVGESLGKALSASLEELRRAVGR
jgi:ribosome recycling factor